MIDTYYAPVYQKEINQESDGEMLFASSPAIRKPNIGRLPVAPKLSAAQVEVLGKKLELAGQVGLGWLR
jgi:hypothetical protein